MTFMKDLFGTERPIIGLMHLKPLPGDPYYDAGGGLEGIVDAARADLAALQDGGVDAVLFTNEFSVPYQQKVSPVVTASMAYVVGRLRDEIRVPYGCEAIYDGDATIDLCAATGAQFTRCLFTDAWAGDLGIVDRDVAVTMRHKYALRLDDLKLFYFITSEDDHDLAGRTVEERMHSLVFECHPDAFVVGGTGPGVAPDAREFRRLAERSGDVPVVAGTGCRPDTVADILACAHGAFVGTAFKRDGIIYNPVDQARVARFMEVARAARGDE